MFYDDDADLSQLEDRTVAIIGYGSQGHAHALNLKDSGVSVVVGLRPDSSSVEDARGHGLEVLDPADAASRGDIVMMLVPDELHRRVWEDQVRDGIASGNLIMFGHGFSIHFGEVEPPADVDVAMVAPKGPGHLVRRQFTEGRGVPCLMAVHQDATGKAHDLTRGKRIIGEPTREAMKEILGEIQSGEFAREWIAENQAGQENFQRMREEQKDHQVEREGRELRKMMDWIDTEF